MVNDIQSMRLKYQGLLVDYFDLAARPSLSDEDADHLDEILEKAESDDILSFLLSEIDYVLAKQLHLFADQHTKKYADQQAWLREYLPQCNPESLECYRELQRLLQRRGFYNGPVDGVMGDHTRKAVEEFQKEESLTPDGFVGPKTVSKLAPTPDSFVRLLHVLCPT
jgi:murein L,D-transpeptidase YcbB/YkuD